jgi:hypothetical protein
MICIFIYIKLSLNKGGVLLDKYVLKVNQCLFLPWSDESKKEYYIGICNLQNISSTLSQDLINSLLLSVPIAPSCLILIDFQNIFIK